MVVEKKKYIIELPENTHWIQWIMESTKDHHPYMDYNQAEDLTPYAEPDLDAIRNEAYEKGVQDTKQHWVDAPRSCAYKLGYENGLNDAWEAARKITCYPIEGGMECSDLQIAFDVDDIDAIMKGFSASEAIEKIRVYEQEHVEQKEEKPIPVEDVMRQYLDMFCKGRSCTGCVLHDFTCGNGTYFLSEKHPVPDEEVRRAYAEVLAKMKEK